MGAGLLAPRAQPAGMLLLLRPQGVPPPVGAEAKLRILRIVPEDLWGEKKPGDTTKTQVLLVPLATHSLTQMTLSPGHQAVSLEHLCSCPGISNASLCFRAGHGPPPFKGCCVPLDAGSAPVASRPVLGKEVGAAHCTQKCCPGPLWAGPTSFSCGSQVWHLLKELLPMQEAKLPQNPGQKLPLKSWSQGMGLATCYAKVGG